MNDQTPMGVPAIGMKDADLFREQCFINGEWCDADGGETIDVTNPASGAKLGTVPKMGADETARAIAAADHPQLQPVAHRSRPNKRRFAAGSPPPAKSSKARSVTRMM